MYIKANTQFSLQRIPWSQYIPEDVLDRLKDCRNKKSDLNILRDALYQYAVDNGQEQNWTIEDAAVLALEWVGDWNNQYRLTDLSERQYDRFVAGEDI